MMFSFFASALLLLGSPALAGDHHHEHAEKIEAVSDPKKGITVSDEHLGFQLSPEAEKNFGVMRVKAQGGQVEVPARAIVTAGTEVNLFRYRAGFYKRIDFRELSRGNGRVKASSSELEPGDEVATEGLGFLRITEIAAFGGAPEGHHH